MTTAISMRPRDGRRGAALVADERMLGLRRRVVATSYGRVVARISPVTGDTALVLLHGAAGSWTTWTPLLRVAERAGTPLTGVIALDLPGWGESAPTRNPIDVPTMSAIVGEVVQALGYEQHIVVGHSLGGFLALDIAAGEPNRTRGALLVSASGPAVIDAIRRPVRGGLRLPGFAGMLLVMRGLAVIGATGTAFVRALGRGGFLRPLSAPLFAHPARVHRSVVDALAGEIRPASFAGGADAAASYDLERWRRIGCPVRAVSGERDVFVADSDAAALAELIPDFTHTTLPDAGHFAAVERPELVLHELRILIEGLPV
ncbi:alpha/beta fold hydrolase [Microbacterium dauci]|uniref:Alpha/beta hydrolase n=1 Tax=Microbacterium dauci TaxID=3048008 RepID=A0ABT6ZAE5_9MICO|nr:alpha/beta hydrolase [Microbacterium sp. LX3-4]MDJ1113129.1 alpha/beta hydrolase [Microbacterium sp. LX3-4]